MWIKRIINADFIIGVSTLTFCGVWISLGLEFPPGTQDGVPSCGTFPILMAVILAAMGLILTIRGFARPSTFFGFVTLPKDNLLAILGTFLILALYLAIWLYSEGSLWNRFGEFLNDRGVLASYLGAGSYIYATLFMTTMLGILYRLDWKTIAVSSLLFTFLTYFVFGQFFHIYLELH